MFNPKDSIQQWLVNFLRTQSGAAGTVHQRQGENLVLAAAVNIPPPVIAATLNIPQGKGMAGLALARSAPVQTCNLQTDQTGEVRPGARAVQAHAAIALPVFNSAGEIYAVVGVAFAREGEISGEAVKKLTEAAATLPE